ncbi:hypothetical protein D915_010143 [Fasciola hepatica]|uniref:Uncharacterized protein n=1 Tax=Fasciola hepatica TaxID=6192 RepID=A0A4E0RCU1_FASHE|nr:hypothetical protein D915_010143 [Fasciola hepatica]
MQHLHEVRSTQRKTKPPRRSVCKKMAEEQCDKTVRFPKENIVGMKACIKQETDNCRRTRQIPAKTKRVVKKDKNKPRSGRLQTEKKPKTGDVSRKRACDNSNKHPCAVTSPTNGASRRVTKLPRRIAIAHPANPEESL